MHTRDGGRRSALKRLLARLPAGTGASGLSILIYHRVGGGSGDERDVALARFADQLDALREHDVVHLDDGLDRLEAGDDRPSVVLAFDDGFADVHDHAWPLLRERGVPFTIYVASAYVGGTMQWEGSTANEPGPALTWDQLGEMVASGLCTVGNHTHTHARPESLTVAELDACSDALERELGSRPRHFAYTWGIPVTERVPDLRVRFRSAATGILGRNHPGDDPLSLRRLPVRQSDPIEFFRAKLTGNLGPERSYDLIVRTAKRLGARG